MVTFWSFYCSWCSAAYGGSAQVWIRRGVPVDSRCVPGDIWSSTKRPFHRRGLCYAVLHSCPRFRHACCTSELPPISASIGHSPADGGPRGQSWPLGSKDTNRVYCPRSCAQMQTLLGTLRHLKLLGMVSTGRTRVRNSCMNDFNCDGAVGERCSVPSMFVGCIRWSWSLFSGNYVLWTASWLTCIPLAVCSCSVELYGVRWLFPPRGLRTVYETLKCCIVDLKSTCASLRKVEK